MENTDSTHCILCNSTRLFPYLDVGSMALANAYLPAPHPTHELKLPLIVAFCEQCFLSQLTYHVEPRVVFQNYAYFSSTSPQIRAHFESYATSLWNRFPRQSAHLVVDIASNDGVLLAPMKALGSTVLGIDPAVNIATVATNNGIPTIPKFFTPTLAKEIQSIHGAASIITANNVIAHTAHIHPFVEGIRALLASDGRVVLQCKYLGDLLEQNAFDTVYHEHISYFLLAPLMRLLSDHDLRIFDVEHVEAEGGSLRIFAAHAATAPLPTPRVQDLLAKEKRNGLYMKKTYTTYAKRPPMLKQQLMKLLKKLQKDKKRVVAYGASAKGGNMLQYCGITEDLVEYIVDAAPAKIGLYMPGSHVPIRHPDTLKHNPPDYIVLLAWNFADSLMEKEAWFAKQGGKFIIAVPTLRVV